MSRVLIPVDNALMDDCHGGCGLLGHVMMWRRRRHSHIQASMLAYADHGSLESRGVVRPLVVACFDFLLMWSRDPQATTTPIGFAAGLVYDTLPPQRHQHYTETVCLGSPNHEAAQKSSKANWVYVSLGIQVTHTVRRAWAVQGPHRCCTAPTRY